MFICWYQELLYLLFKPLVIFFVFRTLACQTLGEPVALVKAAHFLTTIVLKIGRVCRMSFQLLFYSSLTANSVLQFTCSLLPVGGPVLFCGENCKPKNPHKKMKTSLPKIEQLTTFVNGCSIRLSNLFLILRLSFCSFSWHYSFVLENNADGRQEGF